MNLAMLDGVLAKINKFLLELHLASSGSYQPGDARWSSSKNLFILINKNKFRKNGTSCIIVYIETICLN